MGDKLKEAAVAGMTALSAAMGQPGGPIDQQPGMGANNLADAHQRSVEQRSESAKSALDADRAQRDQAEVRRK